MINQDWLDECNLDTTVTFDDLENVLLTFKDKYGVIDPLYMVGDGILDYDQLSGAFDVALKFNSITGQGGFYIGRGWRDSVRLCAGGLQGLHREDARLV